MVVTFCGHRDVICSDDLKRQLKFVLCDLILEGADTFLLGGYGSFDFMAAMTVRELKSTYPRIRSTLVLAYLDRDYNAELYDDIFSKKSSTSSWILPLHRKGSSD